MTRRPTPAIIGERAPTPVNAPVTVPSPRRQAGCSPALHGYDDDPATRRLLRRRPPPPALAWVGAALDGRVLGSAALRGGTTSAVHLVTVRGRSGASLRAVLRRYVRPGLNREEPDIAAREASVLRLLADGDRPTPRLLAVDPTGASAGAPSVLMSWLPGQVVWRPHDLDPWLRRMALVLCDVHRVPLAVAMRTVPAYSFWAPDSDEPPRWSRRPWLWTRALEIAAAPLGPAPLRFLHRDFHPGNILWRRGHVSAVVDWQAAQIGPAAVDVAHCRANLADLGLDAADRFTALWEAASGQRHDPWGDVVAIAGFLDGLREHGPEDGDATEVMLARALAAIDGRPA